MLIIVSFVVILLLLLYLAVKVCIYKISHNIFLNNDLGKIAKILSTLFKISALDYIYFDEYLKKLALINFLFIYKYKRII